MEPNVSARIDAQVPLLRAGLERLATAAQIDVVDTEWADFLLRTPGQPAEEAPVEVTITQGAVVVTCCRPPTPGVWEAVRRVVGAALRP